MKIANTIAALTLAAGSTVAHAGDLAANEQVREYLVRSGLLSEPISADRSVLSRPAPDLGPTTSYLANAGLIETPTVPVRGIPSGVNFAERYSSDERVEDILVDWGLISLASDEGIEGAALAGGGPTEDGRTLDR